MEMVSIPVITILCYFLGEFFKLVILRKKKTHQKMRLTLQKAR